MGHKPPKPRKNPTPEPPKKFLDDHKANFDMLRMAFDLGDAVLMECKDKKTGELVAVIGAMNAQGHRVGFVPFARMFNGNPYDQLLPPKPEGGFDGDGDRDPHEEGGQGTH
jgi:hypothetical protein